MSDPVEIFLVAFATVFAGMAVLTAVLLVMRALGRMTRPPAAPAAPAESTTDAEPDAELIAVLTAAAHAALGQPIRLHRVHVHRERAIELWSRAGRMDIMVSHRVEPKR